MRPSNKYVLISPGKLDLAKGPGSEWIEQLQSNLGLVLKKYSGSDLLSLSAADKVPVDLAGEQLCLITLMHESYSSSAKYLDFIKTVSTSVKGSNPIWIRLETSVREAEKLPEELLNAQTIRLVDYDSGETGWIHEEAPQYWSRLLDLAAEVVAAESTDKEKGGGEVKDRVYLAQTSPELGTSRNILKREISEHGYLILPETELENHIPDLKSYVQSQVDKSRLAIHLLGNSYGEPLKETGFSVAETQIQYISEYLEAIEQDPVHASKEINRLIWIDPAFNPVDSQQEELINKLKRNIESLHRTEIIQTPLELFKTLIIKRLKHKEIKDARHATEGGEKLVYILHSPDDQEEAGKLSGKLAEGGLEIGMLDYGKTQIELLKDHKRNLQECDGAVIYYGNPNRAWLHAKVMDLLKAPGLGRKHPLETRQVLATSNDTLEDYKLPGGLSISREQDLSKAVDQILKTLK
jgi:hypothetical protein